MSKRYSSFKLLLIFSKLLLDLFNTPQKSALFEMLSFRFLIIARKFHSHKCVIYGNKKLLLYRKGVIIEKKGVKFGHQVYVFSLDREVLTIFRFSTALYLENGSSRVKRV